MAPYSDVDLLFLIAPGAHERVKPLVEATLYLLWDLKWIIGHAVRDCDELIALTRDEMTARTAFLEARWMWGNQSLFDDANARFRREVTAKDGRAFVAAKMAERDERHQRMGDSRYLVEPNVKDGKGGLRDLHTLLLDRRTSVRHRAAVGTWSTRACSAPPNWSASIAPNASSGRCDAICT